MDKRKRELILLVIHSCSFNGAPLLGLNIVKELKKRGYFVFAICLDKGELLKQYKKQCFIMYSNSLRRTKIIIKLLKLIGLQNIICNSVLTGDITKIADENKLKVITLIHELPGSIKINKAERKAKVIAKYSHYTIFPNHFVKDKFLTLFPVKRDRVIVKPQGLYMNIHQNYDEKTKQQKKREMGFLPNDKIVICIGYGGIVKGIDLFFRIASNVIKHDRSIRFIWIGDIDSKYNWLSKHIKSNSITLIPPTKQIEDYYRIADLYLITSREDSFPSVVLEAIAYGIPVLGFNDAGGFIELDRKFVNLVDYLDCDAMANAVLEILYDTELLDYVRRYGKKYINQNFDFSQYVTYLLSLFDKIS